MVFDADFIFAVILSCLLFAYAIRSLIFLFVVILRQTNVFLYNISKSLSNSRVVVDSLSISHVASDSKTRYSINNNVVESNHIDRYPTSLGYINNNNSMNIPLPFVSILIATYNEQIIIERLMKSCTTLSYDRKRFEIIVVDDSYDRTFDILKKWEEKLPNLKVIHRTDRMGWKGGALNLALKNISDRSSFVLVVDGDNILLSDTLERFIMSFINSDINSNFIDLIQGYPISKVFSNIINSYSNKNDTKDNGNVSLDISGKYNWISRGIGFRLAKRNLIEFLAKYSMNLPIQVTGSLFMIRSDLIKSVGFSEDLTEDWDLTLDLYLASNHNGSINEKRKLIFNPSLISYCEATIKFKEYFKQRMRVSEGHTRGLKRNILTILTSKMSHIDKMELLFTGLQYAKYLGIIALILLDSELLLRSGTNFIINNHLLKSLLLVQLVTLLIAIGTNFISLLVCHAITNYRIKDAFYLIFLDVSTMPAFILGTLFGLFKKKGIFHKTNRNF